MSERKRKLKKLFWILLIIVVLLLIFSPLIMFGLWYFTPDKPLNIFVLDKTVINKTYQEHLSLNWVLKHDKYVKPDSSFYSPEFDYHGFFPDGNGDYTTSKIDTLSTEELDVISDKYDMAYFTDLYGVYRVEWNNEYPELNPDEMPGRVGERSSLMYGGLKEKELELLLQFKEKKKLVINEFNIIASPTSYSVRKKYEEGFNVRWTGWTGRYIENLDSTINRELPRWLLNNYKNQNDGNWPFKNSGIILVSNSDSVVILENETHLNIELPYIHTDKEHRRYYGIADEMKYPFWFDVIQTSDDNEIISRYQLDTNAKGDSLLQRWRIPKHFPAVIKSKNDEPYYYFAGDFADNPITMKRSRLKYIQNFGFLFYDEVANERKSFFWEFYQPLVSRILEDYYQTLEE